ncbi:MAG: helix-turn-helix domain-containing protein [Woeseiaceae bacterium]
MGVKELRQERNWSQEKLADLSGLSLRTIQRVEAENKAGFDSLRALALAFEIENSALQLELAMDKSSTGWKKRPAWVRAIFFGSGRVRMDLRQHVLVERFAVFAGFFFVAVALFGTNGGVAPESATVPLLIFASMMFFSAYLMSLFIRVGNHFAVWPWIDSNEKESSDSGLSR